MHHPNIVPLSLALKPSRKLAALSLCVAGGLSSLQFASALPKPLGSEKPNIIVILADDLGYGDVGFQGCKDIPTPNIDRLAAEGVRFASGYVCWVACAPSRAGLLTGRDPNRCGFHTNPTPVLASDQGLPPGIPTIPGALQKQGYVTGGIGKWHLGTTPDRHPNSMGFSEWFGFLGGAHDYFTWEHYGKKLPKRPWPEWFVNNTLPILRNNTPVHLAIDSYTTDVFTEEAIEFINHHHEKPFFLYLAYNAPHEPWEAPEQDEAKFSLDRTTPPQGISPKKRRTYVTMVSKLDQGVGRVMETLRQRSLDERTLVFFLSDNGGGPNLTLQGGVLKPCYPSSNYPLRGFKGDLWEGSFRVPFVARWKGKLPAGVNVDDPITSLDIGATALTLAGGAPKEMCLEGVDLMPRLTGQTKAAPHERIFWKEHSRGSVREGRYKLITAEKGAKYELYDLVDDISETRNLAAEKPELVQRLDTVWKAWNAEMPKPAWVTPPEKEWTKPEYQPPLWPEETAGAQKTPPEN